MEGRRGEEGSLSSFVRSSFSVVVDDRFLGRSFVHAGLEGKEVGSLGRREGKKRLDPAFEDGPGRRKEGKADDAEGKRALGSELQREKLLEHARGGIHGAAGEEAKGGKEGR